MSKKGEDTEVEGYDRSLSHAVLQFSECKPPSSSIVVSSKLTHCLQIGAASASYVLAFGLPNGAIREKTAAAFGTAINIFWAVVTNLIVPCMITASFNISWIFGSVAVSGVLVYFFFLPETKVSLSPWCSSSAPLLTTMYLQQVLPWRHLWRGSRSRSTPSSSQRQRN